MSLCYYTSGTEIHVRCRALYLGSGESITRVAIASEQDIDIAVQAARKAYKTSWGLKVPAYERGRLLNKLADLIEEHADEVCAIEALDIGKYPSARIKISLNIRYTRKESWTP